MPDIDWYGPESGGPRSTGARVSYTLPVAKAVRAKALLIGAKAAMLLDARAMRRTDDSHIETRHWPTPGKRPETGPNIDSHIYLTDPWPGNEKGFKGAAQGIENGHWQVGQDGERIRWVKGLHVLRDAAK